MRVLLIHPSDPMHAMDVVPLARLVRAAGHEVLSIVPPQASELIAPIDPALSIVTQDQGLPLRVAAFAPEAFAAIGTPLPESIRSALAGARDLLADATPDTPADTACARLAALPKNQQAAIDEALRRVVEMMSATEVDASPILTTGDVTVGPRAVKRFFEDDD